MKKNIPNFITITRILGTIAMSFTTALTKPFFVLYTYSGFSDVLDGFIARKYHWTSELGSKLDGASDLIFYTVMMTKIIPYLREKLPVLVWIYIAIILLLRVSLYIFHFIKTNSFLSQHTIFNKATGLLMFGIPYMLETNVFIIYAHVVCIVAFIAVIYELYLEYKQFNG